ncbi:MAG: FG-GAP-like repeat-containing protein, partial [Candidatus Neomarinimicrobiota bacterium]
FCVLALALFSFSFAGITGFTRSGEIAIPEATLNNGGVGNMISGVDLDGDGKLEIYLVNDNWNDGATEVIARIYKLEKNGASWDVVWQAKLDPFCQNTWPVLIVTDLDNDTKKEVTWMPVNSTSVSANPVRIAVFEQGAGEIMGIDDGAGGYRPNSTWTITTEDNINIRPIDAEAVDIDGDDVTELVFADRAGNSNGYYVGVCSVSNIPDNGDGSETWTMEASGKDWSMTSTVQNKWDVAVLGHNAYFFSETEVSKLSWDGSSWGYDPLSPLAGGSPVQSAMAVDLNNDGTKEIICAVYDWGDDTKKGIYLLQEDADTLKPTELVNLSAFWPGGSRGPWGGASGDIDNDGKLDFVFGSRAATPNGLITCLSYKSGDITNPASYELMLIDSLYSATAADGIWSVLNIANIDDDPEKEILYTSSASIGGIFAGSAPIIILDATVTSGAVEFGELGVVADLDSVGIRLKPGRILGDGQTIWIAGTGSSLFEGNFSCAYLSTDGGATFTKSANVAGHRVAQLDAFDASIAVMVTAEGSIWRTDNGGTSWTEVHSYSGGWFDGVRVLNSDVAVAYGDGMYFCRSIDKGATWTAISGIDYKAAIEAIYTYGTAACNVGETAWFAAYPASGGTMAYVFKTEDAGVNWSTIEIPVTITKERRLYGISFADVNNGMANANGKKPIYTTDGGVTWDSCATNPGAAGDAWVNSVIAVPGENIFIALCDNEMYYTSDMGDTWIKMATPTNTDDEFFISAVVLNKDNAYFMTQQGTVLTFGSGNGIVNNTTRILDNFKLHQNYPNPFNATTNIVFDVPNEKAVTLTIYDLLGKEVVKLVDTKMSAGTYTATWNGLNRNGYPMSTGIYFYALKIGNITKVKRMTLVK